MKDRKGFKIKSKKNFLRRETTNYESYLFLCLLVSSCSSFRQHVKKRFSHNFNLAGISKHQSFGCVFAIGNCLHLYVLSTKARKRQPRFYHAYGFQNARFNRTTRLLKFFARLWCLLPSGIVGNNWNHFFSSNNIILSYIQWNLLFLKLTNS